MVMFESQARNVEPYMSDWVYVLTLCSIHDKNYYCFDIDAIQERDAWKMVCKKHTNDYVTRMNQNSIRTYMQ